MEPLSSLDEFTDGFSSPLFKMSPSSGLYVVSKGLTSVSSHLRSPTEDPVNTGRDLFKAVPPWFVLQHSYTFSYVGRGPRVPPFSGKETATITTSVSLQDTHVS